MKRENDHDRLFWYAVRFLLRHARTAWPTVRQAARALGWTHERVHDAVAGDPEARMCTTSYPGPDPPPGDHYVETYELPKEARAS